MKILLASIAARRAAGPAAELAATYVARAARYTSCEHRLFATEAKLLALLAESSRMRPYFVLTDSAGRHLSSAELAGTIGVAFDAGVQTLVLAVGPADGWSASAMARADLVLAFGRITLPHELALAVTAEQVYRALTIRAGHPYHVGH